MQRQLLIDKFWTMFRFQMKTDPRSCERNHMQLRKEAWIHFIYITHMFRFVNTMIQCLRVFLSFDTSSVVEWQHGSILQQRLVFTRHDTPISIEWRVLTSTRHYTTIFALYIYISLAKIGHSTFKRSWTEIESGSFLHVKGKETQRIP